MSTVSFGFSSGSGGTTILGVGQHASKYTNTTGGYVSISSLDLTNIFSPLPTGVSWDYQLAVYSDFPGYPYPYQLMGYTEIKALAAMAAPTTNFLVDGDPIVVGPGRSVWFVFQGTGGIKLTAVDGVDQRSSSELQDWETTWPSTFKPTPGLFDNFIPIIAYGDNTAPTATTNLRSNFTFVEPLSEGSPAVSTNLSLAEALSEGYAKVYSNLIILESLHPVSPELPMSTIPFPGFGNSPSTPSIPQSLDPFNSALPGLAFSVHKKPIFNTRVSEAPSGGEVRSSQSEYPRWEFTLPYEFLEDRSGAESSLKQIMGFFLARRGRYDSWLFKDPDDYLATRGNCGTSDGLTTVFPLRRTLGEFSEKVGQLDTANSLVVYLQLDEARTIPSTGPYTITVTHAAAWGYDNGVTKGGLPMTLVTGTPTTGQYSVSAGVYTFAAADASSAIIINYGYIISSSLYTVTLPNLITFTSAPAAGIITADFQFFFACRFLEDEMDFEKFYDKLWSLHECSFRSIIQ